MQPEARVLEHQQLDPIPALVEEHEQRSAQRVQPQIVTGNRCQAIELPAEVDGIARDEDPDGVGGRSASGAAQCENDLAQLISLDVRRDLNTSRAVFEVNRDHRCAHGLARRFPGVD